MAKRESSHEPMATANAVAVTTAIVFVACRLLVGAIPGFMYMVGRSWIHTVEWQMRAPGGPDQFLLGLVTATVFAWLVGYLFATLYTMFSKK